MFDREKDVFHVHVVRCRDQGGLRDGCRRGGLVLRGIDCVEDLHYGPRFLPMWSSWRREVTEGSCLY